MLVSRTKGKLQDVAKEIEDKYNVNTLVIDIDFTKDKNARERIESETKVFSILKNKNK